MNNKNSFKFNNGVFRVVEDLEYDEDAQTSGTSNLPSPFIIAPISLTLETFSPAFFLIKLFAISLIVFMKSPPPIRLCA